ncbi:Imm50 family immunity protein [Streptomyces sp. NBC_00572]|uniref:Imm50 family immunity protein n=1 Tax=Streptomyces sp. NBC_00572 TaxID=2903664 RepID=UPI0022542604|nr:Imm50 family immunity protein [Streptomyces sp. NBC_00572]MCX4981972.1 immunity 50 family protein [Streptomyces sp. NBC_00572]
MGDSDWTTIINSAESITSSYTTPPNLNECTLEYVQIDERSTSVTLAFETSVLPSNPPPAWADREYNTVEFFLKFTGVKELQVVGWDFTARDAAVTLTPFGEGVRVSVDGAGSHLAFTAEISLLTRTRPYLSSRGSD